MTRFEVMNSFKTLFEVIANRFQGLDKEIQELRVEIALLKSKEHKPFRVQLMEKGLK